MESRLYNYRRRLPHYQKAGAALFVTFRKSLQGIFPANARDEILRCCRYGDGSKFELLAVVVMPDHVHLLFIPLPDVEGWPYSASQILKSIKGASARAVNKLSGTNGQVWQDESFDHVLRNDESLHEKMDYILGNPVRKGLVSKPEDYPWLWVQDGWKFLKTYQADSQRGQECPRHTSCS